MTRRSTVIGALFLGAVLVGGAVLADETATADDEGTFRVEKSQIDIGTMQAGKEGEFVFVFHNGTERDVKILRAKPT